MVLSSEFYEEYSSGSGEDPSFQTYKIFKHTINGSDITKFYVTR